jgi:hypothetical protein
MGRQADFRSFSAQPGRRQTGAASFVDPSAAIM